MFMTGILSDPTSRDCLGWREKPQWQESLHLTWPSEESPSPIAYDYDLRPALIPPPPVMPTRMPWFVGATKQKVVRKQPLGKPGIGDTWDMMLGANISRAGAGLNTLDPEQERDPPPPATPITFPGQDTYTSSAWTEETPPPKLQPLFSKVLKPADISNSHVQALNVQVVANCSPQDLLPLQPDGSSYLPPLSLSPDQAINAASYAEATKVDAAVAKKRKEFDERLAELKIDNDAGYRVINRNTKPGTKPARLAYFRKFWEGLESMSQYWDTSLDHYYEGVPAPSSSEDSGEKGPKRQRLDSGQTSLPILSSPESQDDDAKKETTTPDPLEVATQTPLPPSDDQPAHINGNSPDPRACLRYKGRRTASGKDMPDQFRTDTVRAFVEGVVWPFQCQVAAPRIMPIVQMNKLNLPVRQTAAVYRLPKERSKVRSGWLEGPILTIQVRPDIDFEAGDLSEAQRQTRARLDLMRELGGLLQCAQERSRQGKTETKPGQGKWWTEKPRWGGGPGGEVEAQEGSSESGVKEILQMAEEMVGGTKERNKSRKKKTPAMLWKELKCGSGVWDPKLDYMAVGKDPSSDWDEVFMVSSLNHHISVLKLTIHNAYTEYLRTEELPSPPPSDPGWCSPKPQRTKWFDLFDIEQRVEAFQALWAVMVYLLREPPAPAPPAGAEGTANA